MKENKYKLAIVTSHPIQYQAPFFREISLNKGIELKVFFEKKDSVNPSGFFDKQFNRKIKWDIPLLGGYDFYFIRNIFDFYKNLKKEKPDAVLILGWDSFYKIFVIFFSKLFKTKIFIRSENPLNQEKIKSGLKQWIKKIILKMLFKRISAFLFIGKQNKNFYKSYGISEEKLFFTPYTVDNKRLQSSYNNLKPKKNNFRARLGIKEEDIVILFVGKFIHKKRPLHLLEAYKKVLNLDKNNNKIHLVFVGEGELRIEMENYINKNNLSYVHLVGFKNQTELPEYYTMSDMFILPSGVGETWGLVTNEAMNFELPIIISDMPGSGYDLVKDGENGYMFQLGNIDDLSNKIFKLVKDKEKREKFGEKSFEFIKNYNYEKDVEGILKALNLN
jgi:glycosyltransferase involved in cell wall biosynthesis